MGLGTIYSFDPSQELEEHGWHSRTNIFCPPYMVTFSNLDAIGPAERVLVREVSIFSGVQMYTNTVLGEGECVQ